MKVVMRSLARSSTKSLLEDAGSQSRFTSSESFAGGTLYLGKTNFWIFEDTSSIRLVLSQDLELLNLISNQLVDF